jgi:hypothetical protein
MARRVMKVLGWAAGVLLVGVLLVVAGVYVLLQTQTGHDFVLRSVLAQAPRFVQGEVQVGGVRSDGLLGGFVLSDVRITDERGRPFLEAESLSVRYAWRGLLRGEVILVPVELVSPRVVIEMLHGDEEMNVARIFGPAEPRDPAAPTEPDPPSLTLILRRIRITDGEVLVRLPIEGDEPPPRTVVETVPGIEGLHQRFLFTGMEALVAEADLLDPETGGQRIEFDELSMVGQIFEEPFDLEVLRGTLSLTGSRLALDLDRLWFPDSELAGRVALDWGDPDQGVVLDVALEADLLRFRDFAWLEPRLPEGEGAMDLTVTGPLDALSWRITDAELSVDDARLTGRVGFEFDGGFRFVETDLDVRDLTIAQIEPWLDEPLPFAGRLNGQVALAGPFDALSIDGAVQYDDPEREIPPSNLRFNGVLELGPEIRVRNLVASIDPLRFETLVAFAPDLRIAGEGRLELEASGVLSSGMRVDALLLHRPFEGGALSRVAVAGELSMPAGADLGRLRLALDGTLEPLSFDGVAAALGTEFPVGGELSGGVRLDGLLADLGVAVDLVTPAGAIDAEVRLDALDPGRGYSAAGRVSDFALHTWVTGLPDPFIITADFEVEGTGLSLDDFAGRGEVDIREASIDAMEIESFRTVFRADGGVLHLDEFALTSDWLVASGEGNLALRDDVESGSLSLRWEIESLARLNPLLPGEAEEGAADAPTAFDQFDLLLLGIDPDTLPGAGARRLEGSAFGEIHLRGTLRDLMGTGFMEVVDATYGEFSAPEGRARFRGGLEDLERLWGESTITVVEGTAGRFAFERIELDASLDRGQGDVRLRLDRDEAEAYRLGFAYSMDEEGIDILLDELVLEVDPVEWRLDDPSPLRIEGRSVRVAGLRVTRPPTRDQGVVRMEVDGILDLDDESAFHIELEGVDIGRVARVFQIEAPPSGFLDLTLDVRGPAEAPILEGTFLLESFEVAGTELSRVEGELMYADLRGVGTLTADLNGRRLLSAEARLPMDLAFGQVEDRFPDRTLDVTIQVDSLPAATALAFLDMLEEVEGSLDGRIDVRGTPTALLPSGEIRLTGGAVSIPEQGLRMTGIGGDFRLLDNRILEVDLQARARGDARVQGTISLEDPADPGFDLRVSASGFQAVDRRDLNARVGGEVTLQGRYSAPRLGGTVRVEQGAIFVEEFARSAEVVDLTDPLFFDVIDTTLVTLRPQLAAAQNPFIQNLRVDVNLSLQRDFWLRSREMNVEMGGNLSVDFDRPRREIVLVGSLAAIRGSYTAFGRTFQVQAGSVEFPGTPGIDPALDIVAVNRLRREGGEPLDIVANVGGTLQNLRIDLSSDSQPPIAQSDLISYLIFGRPSYALASGETSVLEGAAGAGVSVGVGAIATQLGSAVAQQIGLDYFTITQSRDGAGIGTAAGLSGTFADTQIEVGQYLSDNLFLALVLRPLTGLGARGQNQFPGARMEWRFTDLWTLEGFVEDRFAREGSAGFGELGLTLSKVFGLSVYREWGY